ncbi:hypothetical protein K438DRAFT_1994419 [Mycena galopus ATCC 62051]|nr:hypothetical protein K438DRAFT_1994419 [Mycena galopus ATCC 62051]
MAGEVIAVGEDVKGFALQFAVASGATVIATSSSDEKLKIAIKLGAKHVINYKTTPGWAAEVLKLTSGVGVDRVVDVGGNATLSQSIRAARKGGSIDIIGRLGGIVSAFSVVLHTHLPMWYLHRSMFPLSILSTPTSSNSSSSEESKLARWSSASGVTFHYTVFIPCRPKDAIKLISANIEATRPVIDKVFDFKDAKTAYAHMVSQVHVGKVIIKT